VVGEDLDSILIVYVVVRQIEHSEVLVKAQFSKHAQDRVAVNVVLAALEVLELDFVSGLEVEKVTQTRAVYLVSTDVKVLERGVVLNSERDLLHRLKISALVVLHETLLQQLIRPEEGANVRD